MKKLITGVLATAAVVIIAFSACNTRKDEPPDVNPSDTLKQLTVDSIQLQWQVDSEYLHVKVTATTTGWIAAGFNSNPAMQGANLIIGFVRNDSAFVRDDYGSGPNTHDADVNGAGTSDIQGFGGTEGTNVTEISFTIPLDSGDPRDLMLIEGSTYYLILAYGENSADDFTSYHKHRVATTITI